jgi:glycosyltransferase involved in cell wall biosynthesis
VASSLGKGGAERATSLQSKLLSHLGYDVHIVIVNSIVDYEYEGQLFDLGALRQKGINRISRLNHFRKYLKAHDFYAIIDNRSRVQAYREFIITKFIYKKPTIYVIHSFEKNITFNAYKWLNTWLYKNKTMVGVSSDITNHFKKLYGLNNVSTIHNALDIETVNKEALDLEIYNSVEDPFVIYFGRIDNISKNLKLLLEAYKNSKLPSQGIKLLLLGSGPDSDELKDYANELEISNHVVFKNQLKNPFPLVKKAIFTILTSHFEGFPLVLLESLSLGTPVISVDSKSGPDEIINSGFNGLLVENYNVKVLSEAMNSFIFDKELYATCKANAKGSVQQFSMDEIAKKWQSLLNEI